MPADLKNLKIVFFDVGNVFVSDDPSGCYCYHCLYEAFPPDKRPLLHEFFHERVEHLRAGGNLWTFIKGRLPEGEFHPFRNRVRGEIFRRWPELSPPVPGMAHAARELAKCYRLGLIANQPKDIEPLLQTRGILELFEIRAISESLEIDKPDLRIFEWAVEKAGVEPQEAMMVGDRIDNDIKPAKAVGMQTLWLRLSFEKRGWSPSTDFELQFAESVKLAYPSDVGPKDVSEEPDLIATSPNELIHVLGCDLEKKS